MGYSVRQDHLYRNELSSQKHDMMKAYFTYPSGVSKIYAIASNTWRIRFHGHLHGDQTLLGCSTLSKILRPDCGILRMSDEGINALCSGE